MLSLSLLAIAVSTDVYIFVLLNFVLLCGAKNEDLNVGLCCIVLQFAYVFTCLACVHFTCPGLVPILKIIGIQ